MDLISGPSGFSGQTRPVDFIRHGSTKLNGDTPSGKDRIRGWIDVPLDDRGVREAEKLGRELALLKTKPRVLFTSDLQRASHTAHIISQMAGIPIAPVKQGLRPWNLGDFHGKESATIAPMMKKFVDNPDHRVPNGESFNEFRIRFLSTLHGILAGTQYRIGLVSHHRNERLLAASEKTDWRGFDKQEFAKRGGPPGVVLTFDIPFQPRSILRPNARQNIRS